MDRRVKGSQIEITTAFKTTTKAIRRIQASIQEEVVFSKALHYRKPGGQSKITPEIEAGVVYIL